MEGLASQAAGELRAAEGLASLAVGELCASEGLASRAVRGGVGVADAAAAAAK